MVIAAICRALILANAAVGASYVDDRVTAVEKRIDGGIGFALLGTNSGRRLGYRQNERFLMCSTFKFLAVAAVLQRVDQRREQLDQFVPYTAVNILEYAPVTKAHLSEGGMKLSDLCAAAICQSDNTAGNLLLDVIGGPSGLTKFARTLGDQVTRLDRKEPELNRSANELDITSPAAMADDMQQLLVGEILSQSSRRKLEAWLAANETGKSLIRAGVSATWAVGDKTGRGGNGATNDIAIIRPLNRKPIFLVIYSTDSLASAEVRDAAVAEVAKIVLEPL